eukprot:997094-Alexandrium_andersonii.AAC.1
MGSAAPWSTRRNATPARDASTGQSRRGAGSTSSSGASSATLGGTLGLGRPRSLRELRKEGAGDDVRGGGSALGKSHRRLAPRNNLGGALHWTRD